MPLPISVCMIVKNETAHLERCLQSVQALASEIIVVDTGSTDDTRDIARQFGAHVIEAPWDDDFSKARNISLEAASQPWILVIDADETLPNATQEALRAMWPNLDPKAVYSFPLYVQGQGNWTYKQYLFPNDPNLRYAGRVHEQIHPAAPGYHKVVLDALQVDHWQLDKGTALAEEKSQYYAELLERSLEEDPADPTPHVFLAWFHINQKAYEKALRHTEQAIERVAPQSNYRLMAHLYAALAHYHQRQWEDALREAQAGIDLYHACPELHAVKGLALLENQQPDLAEQALGTAVYLSRRPSTSGVSAISALRSPAILDSLAAVYDHQRKVVPARICRKLHRAKAEEMPAILGQELTSLLKQKDFRGALWLITLFFPVEMADWGQGLLRHLNGPRSLDKILAEADLWSTLQVFGQQPATIKRLLKDATMQYPLDPRAWQRLADFAIQNNDWAEAVEPLERAAALNAKSGWAWNALGIASLMTNKTDKAKDCFRKAIQIGMPEEVEQAKANLNQLAQTTEAG